MSISVINPKFGITRIFLVAGCVLVVLGNSPLVQSHKDGSEGGREFPVSFSRAAEVDGPSTLKIDLLSPDDEDRKVDGSGRVKGYTKNKEEEEGQNKDVQDEEDGEEEDEEEEEGDVGEETPGRSDLSQDEETEADVVFRREDLIDDVTELERDAQLEEQSSLLPQILGLFNNNNEGHGGLDSLWDDGDVGQNREKSNDTSLPEDLSELSEDIVDDIAAGVEESLLLSDDSLPKNSTEMRQFSIYMFQGQYVPESRLNRFVDGAIRNMGGELRIAVMDPLYFRVLPRGRVESRQKPIGKLRTGIGAGANWEDLDKTRVARVAGFFDRFKQKVGQKKVGVGVAKKQPVKKRKVNNNNAGTRRGIKNRRRKPGLGGLRRRPNNRNRNQNRRRKFFRKRKKPQGNRRRRPGNKKKNNRNKKKKQQQRIKNRRQKRRARRNVGGGRVEGLSVLSRDGDAEMQVFGNYTLIRSHMKMGPVELSMQFRTRRGLRRTGATLPVIRMHTVTRVNMEGSEMIDFLLDRPHPESIKVRGKLFPLAQRIARNIFARLFVPNSFLVSKLREKASMALLSKPKANK